MKIIAYGVSNWSDTTPADQIELNCEWYKRIIKYIPGVTKVIVTTGNYSDPKTSPFHSNIKIVQNNIPLTEPYSNKHNYFRNGFITGIWHALLNEPEWDILFHIQPRVLIGANMSKHLHDFMNTDKSVMCARLINSVGYSMEISLLAMKRQAVQTYATRGFRQSFEIENTLYISTCEEEAFKLFHKTWYNPWDNIITTRQYDWSMLYNNTNEPACFQIKNIDDFSNLPFISTGKHVSDEFKNKWIKKNYI